jgi:hypothetical protein
MKSLTLSYKIISVIVTLSLISGIATWVAFAPASRKKSTAAQEAQFKSATYPIAGNVPASYHGTLVEQRVGEQGKAGLELFINGVKAVDTFTGLGSEERMRQAYGMIPKNLLDADQVRTTHYRMSVTIEQMMDDTTLQQALMSKQDERINWAARYIMENMSPREGLPYTPLLLKVLEDTPRSYDVTVHSTLHHIGAPAFQYFSSVLNRTNSAQSLIIGNVLGEAEPYYPELIHMIITRYPNNQAFMQGVLPSFMFGRNYKPEVALPVLLDMMKTASHKTRLQIVQAVGNYNYVDNNSLRILTAALTDADIKMHKNALKSLQRLVPDMNAEQKDYVAALVKREFDKAESVPAPDMEVVDIMSSYKKLMARL